MAWEILRAWEKFPERGKFVQEMKTNIFWLLMSSYFVLIQFLCRSHTLVNKILMAVRNFSSKNFEIFSAFVGKLLTPVQTARLGILLPVRRACVGTCIRYDDCRGKAVGRKEGQGGSASERAAAPRHATPRHRAVAMVLDGRQPQQVERSKRSQAERSVAR